MFNLETAKAFCLYLNWVQQKARAIAPHLKHNEFWVHFSQNVLPNIHVSQQHVKQPNLKSRPLVILVSKTTINKNNSASSTTRWRRRGAQCSPHQHIRRVPALVALKVPVYKMIGLRVFNSGARSWFETPSAAKHMDGCWLEEGWQQWADARRGERDDGLSPVCHPTPRPPAVLPPPPQPTEKTKDICVTKTEWGRANCCRPFVSKCSILASVAPSSAW